MQIEEQVKIFKALSNHHRLSIYLKLVDCCEVGTLCSTDGSDIDTCVGEVASGHKLAPSTVSHHLKELRQAGLIKMEKRGQRSFCYVIPEMLEELGRFFQSQLNQSSVKNKVVV